MYLGIDIGGTKTLLAVFSKEGSVEEEIKFPTSQDYAQFKKDFADNFKKLSAQQFLGGCIGTRGTIDREKGLLIDGGSALPWKRAPLVSDLGKLAQTSLLIENDAKLSGLSEASLVKDRFKKVVYLTISSGIGGAYVVDGVIYPNTVNAEMGLMIFEHKGQIQTWENFASGKAIVEQFGKQAKDITDPETWGLITKNIAIGIVNVSAVLTPEVIIIGGGVGSNLSRFEKPLKAWLETFVNDVIGPDLVTVPPILKAQRPEEAVIYGCYEYIKQNL